MMTPPRSCLGKLAATEAQLTQLVKIARHVIV